MIVFASADIEVLRQIPSVPRALLEKLDSEKGHPVQLSDDEQELLLEAVGEHLASHGFDAAYRPTELGTALESLIDRITANPHD